MDVGVIMKMPTSASSFLSCKMRTTMILFFFFLIILYFIYLFLAMLGLRFCARAFSSCGKRRSTLHHGARASHYRGLSCCGAQTPDAQAQ